MGEAAHDRADTHQAGKKKICQPEKKNIYSTTAGFEPTRAMPTRFRVWRLNHSAMLPIVWPQRNGRPVRADAIGRAHKPGAANFLRFKYFLSL